MAVSLPIELRLEIEDLYVAYARALDNFELEQWLDLFAAESFYQIIPRENFDRGLPLATMRCESREMMADRVYAIRETAMYEPRYMRRLISGIVVTAADDSGWQAEANYAVFETCPGQLTQVFSVGRYLDRIVREEGALRFARKDCVFDSELIPTSIVYPI